MDFNEVILNISGTRFFFEESILNKLPPSCFQYSKMRCRKNDGVETKEFYFDRHAESFRALLWYFTNGELHMPSSICPSIFRSELNFWDINPSNMSRCCYMRYVSFFDDQRLLKSFADKEKNSSSENNVQKNWETKHTTWENFKEKGWKMMNYPTSSRMAKVYTLFSTLVILMSIFVLCASTHPSFQRELELNEWEEYYKGDEGMVKTIKEERIRRQGRQALQKINTLQRKLKKCDRSKNNQDKKECVNHKNENWRKEILKQKKRLSKNDLEKSDTDKQATNCTGCNNNSSSKSVVVLPDHITVARYHYLDLIENILFVYFALELTFRFICCPQKRRFLFDILNIIDIVALSSEAVTMTFSFIFPKERYATFSPLNVIECIQIVRLFRLFRIVKNFTGFRALVYSVKATLPNMALNVFLLLTAALIFSTIEYYCDREQFRSIPDAMWWAIVTMTTVGYGDMSPRTVLGKLVGCACAISGVFVLAVLIPVFVQNFLLVFDFARINDKPQQRSNNTSNGESDETLEVKSVKRGD